MTIDQLIARLEELRSSIAGENHAATPRRLSPAAQLAGATPVVWESLSHSWDVEPVLRRRAGKQVVLVNP